MNSNGVASLNPVVTVEDLAGILSLEKATKGEWHGQNPFTKQGEDRFILFADGNGHDRNSGENYTSIQMAQVAGVEPNDYEPVRNYKLRNGDTLTMPLAPLEREASLESIIPKKTEKVYVTATLEERGLTQETQDHFLIEKTSEAYQFPTFGTDGRDAAPGRSRRKMFDPVEAGQKYSKNKKPIKYMWVPGDTDPIPAGYHLEVCHEFNEPWLVGGEVDVWTCHEIGVPALCGFGETRKLGDLIKAVAKIGVDRLHIALDNDEAGIRGSLAAIEACKEHGVQHTVRQIVGAAGTDVNDLFKQTGFDKAAAKLALQSLPHASKATIDGWKFALERLSSGQEETPKAEKRGRKPGSKNGSSDEKMQKTETLIHLLGADIELVLSEDEELFVGFVGADGLKRNYQSDDANLRSDLFDFFYEKTGKSISKDVVDNAMQILRGRARRLKLEGDVWLRAAPYDNEDGEHSVFINLGDRDARVIEINQKFDNGWRVTQDCPVRFRWPKGMQALPIPQRGGNIEQLRECINADDEAVWMMMLSWGLYAMTPPQRPYPALVLTGEQGTAKSTTSRMLRLLIDPHYSLISSMTQMKDAEDLTNLCNTSHILGFDNLTGLNAWQSDTLCQIATDGRIPRRKRFTDNETVYTRALCPMLLNGIDESLGREDFQSRSIRCNLPYIPKQSRQDEERVWKHYHEIRPKMIGALCTIMSVALAERPKVKMGEMPRMADFAKFIVAAENGGAMPWKSGRFLMNYYNNIKEVSESALEANPVALELVRLVDRCDFIEETATDLLKKLNNNAEVDSKNHFSWPAAPNKLSAMLNRVAPVLREHDIDIKLNVRNARSGKNRTRFIQIRKMPEFESPKQQQMFTMGSGDDFHTM